MIILFCFVLCVYSFFLGGGRGRDMLLVSHHNCFFHLQKCGIAPQKMSAVVSKTTEDAHLSGKPGACFQFFGGRTYVLLFLCIFYFDYFMFFDVCVCFTCLAFILGLQYIDFCSKLGSLFYFYLYMYCISSIRFFKLSFISNIFCILCPNIVKLM